MPPARDDLSAVVQRNFLNLTRECPPDTILALTVVLVEGSTSVIVAMRPEVSQGGPDPQELRLAVGRAVRDYLRACPNVAWIETGGSVPS